jgi:hypothetical protein
MRTLAQRLALSLLALASLLGAAPRAAQEEAPPPIDSRALGNEILDRLHALSPGADLNQRLLAASEPLLGRPYRADPLGEHGLAPDDDPMYRFDAFDCQTLLETTLALANAEDLPHFVLYLSNIRYHNGRARFQDRNHLVEAQWAPHNLANGTLRDITADIGGAAAKKVRVSVVRQGLERPYLKFLSSVGEQWPIGDYQLPYLPIEWAIEHAHRIPEGTIIQIVREPRRGVPHAVTHQGIVLQRPDGQRVFRNASSSPRFQKVVDRSVVGYLTFSKTYFSKGGRWPVIGVNLLQAQPSPKAALLTASTN